MSEVEREAELLAICKEKQGEYIPNGHPKTSWARTYGNDFIKASSELYLICKKQGKMFPQYSMSRSFINADIRSCKGAEMNPTKVEYLIKNCILPYLKEKRVTYNIEQE